jgi:acetyltransferase-like isoleucine patch superfamily enzyme
LTCVRDEEWAALASLKYLWSNRARFPLGSASFHRAWAKRVQTLPAVVRSTRRRSSLVRRGARLSATCEIGELTVNGRRSLLAVGESSFLGRVRIELHEAVTVGSNVCINDGVTILTASHDVTDVHWTQHAEAINIDDFVWVGMNAIILPGVHLGRGCVVGAGAVVARSVAAGAVVVGNPAQMLKTSRAGNLDYDPCSSLAANSAWLNG